jgi:hypothetical protein
VLRIKAKGQTSTIHIWWPLGPAEPAQRVAEAAQDDQLPAHLQQPRIRGCRQVQDV